MSRSKPELSNIDVPTVTPAMLAVYGRVVTWKHLILTATGIFLLMGAGR
jgi:hypothetical protein